MHFAKRVLVAGFVVLLAVGAVCAQEAVSSATPETPVSPYLFQVIPPNISIVTGLSNAGGSLVLNIVPVGGFNQTVTFACVGMPAHAGCTFNPTSLTLDGVVPQSSNLTISTNGSVTTTERTPSRHHWLALASLGMLGLFMLPAVRRSRRNLLPLLFMGTIAFLILPACGSSSTNSNYTAPGTYNITINTTYGTPTPTTVGPSGALTITVTAK